MTNRSEGNLTEVVQKVGQKIYDRNTQNWENDEYPSWGELSPLDRQRFMQSVLPIITDVLDVVDEEREVLADMINSSVIKCPVHNMTDCSPLLNGCSIPNHLHKQAESDAAIVRKGL